MKKIMEIDNDCHYFANAHTTLTLALPDIIS